MKAPAFWDKKESWQSKILHPFGVIYAWTVARRLRRAATDCGIPVICVGNVGVGGTGKTPVCLAIGEILKQAGIDFYYLNHGYHAKLKNRLVSPGVQTAVDVGDEALLLAEAAPTVVDNQRARGALTAKAAGAQAIVMDDGFQNPDLKKDLSFVVVDGRKGFGNEQVVPAGPLREPVPVGLKRADAVIIVGDDTWGVRDWLNTQEINLPVLTGQFLPDMSVLLGLKGKKVTAFAGIGNPDKFFHMLTDNGLDVVRCQAFPDHYFYTRFDIEQLVAEANGLPVLTTTKDFVKIPRDLQAQMTAVSGRFQFDDSDAMVKLIQEIIA